MALPCTKPHGNTGAIHTLRTEVPVHTHTDPTIPD